MLLFLDFDGVCHRLGAPVDELFRRSEALLEPWLRERPGVDVVVSSSWRESKEYPLEAMRGFFGSDLRARLVGTTPVIRHDEWAQFDGELGPTRFERELEVRRWLAGSGQPWRPWAALDDVAALYRPDCKNLVVCDGRQGMTANDLVTVDAILRRQA